MMKSQKQDNHIYLRYKLVWYNKISSKYRNAQGLSMYKYVFFAKYEERICSFQWPCAFLYFYSVLKKLFWHYFATPAYINIKFSLLFNLYFFFFFLNAHPKYLLTVSLKKIFILKILFTTNLLFLLQINRFSKC